MQLDSEQALRIAGPRLRSAHFHDTRGLGLANAFAAYEAGCRKFDANVDGGERRGDHEDDEKHQHHVDERRDVDFVGFGQIVICTGFSAQTRTHDLLRSARDAQ